MNPLSQILQQLQERGFINYFGMQRFGTHSVPTHAMGLALIEGDLATAIDLIFYPRVTHDAKSAEQHEFRKVFNDTRSPAKAFEIMPPWLTLEKDILTSLAESPKFVLWEILEYRIIILRTGLFL